MGGQVDRWISNDWMGVWVDKWWGGEEVDGRMDGWMNE